MSLAVAALLASALAASAPGDLLDCHDPRWIAAAYQNPSFDCAEIGRRDVTVSTGVAHRVRALHDRAHRSQEAERLGHVMMDAIAAAIPVYAQLGLPTGNVDIVFFDGDGAVKMGGGRETGAPVPQPIARATVYSSTTCLVLVQLGSLTPAEIAEVSPELRFTAAHDIAHCAQQWAWPMQSHDAANQNGWSSEGSADAIASAAMPLERLTRSFMAAFDAASPHVPLTGFVYEASPFFMWLLRVHRDRFDALMDCIARGPGDRGASIQNQCLLSTVGADGLNGFARAYFDRTIETLDGAALPLVPRAGDVADARTGDTAIEGAAAVMTLWRTTIRLGPGRWHLDAGKELSVAGVQGPSGWIDLPRSGAEFALPCGTAREFVVYVMPTEAAEQRFALSASRIEDAACDGR